MPCGNRGKVFSCGRLPDSMYITTFYSFKGGVGRTMALVNVAVTLALRGRRVLVVDFDVEAPGLDTFDVLRPREEVLESSISLPNIWKSGKLRAAASFIGECPVIGDQGGGLWIMPSGRNETYAAKFNRIDWGALYERHEGFLLFEDLKEQWDGSYNRITYLLTPAPDTRIPAESALGSCLIRS